MYPSGNLANLLKELVNQGGLYVEYPDGAPAGVVSAGYFLISKTTDHLPPSILCIDGQGNLYGAAPYHLLLNDIMRTALRTQEAPLGVSNVFQGNQSRFLSDRLSDSYIAEPFMITKENNPHNSVIDVTNVDNTVEPVTATKQSILQAFSDYGLIIRDNGTTSPVTEGVLAFQKNDPLCMPHLVIETKHSSESGMNHYVAPIQIQIQETVSGGRYGADVRQVLRHGGRVTRPTGIIKILQPNYDLVPFELDRKQSNRVPDIATLRIAIAQHQGILIRADNRGWRHQRGVVYYDTAVGKAYLVLVTQEVSDTFSAVEITLEDGVPTAQAWDKSIWTYAVAIRDVCWTDIAKHGTDNYWSFNIDNQDQSKPNTGKEFDKAFATLKEFLIQHTGLYVEFLNEATGESTVKFLSDFIVTYDGGEMRLVTLCRSKNSAMGYALGVGIERIVNGFVALVANVEEPLTYKALQNEPIVRMAVPEHTTLYSYDLGRPTKQRWCEYVVDNSEPMLK